MSHRTLQLRHFPSRNGNLPGTVLGLIVCLAAIAIVVVEADKGHSRDSLLSEKRAAMELMAQSIAIIRAEKIRAGIQIDRVADPNETGMIGERYNDLTTTVGSLPSKRTSTNPAFAAAVVEMLTQAGVRRGDSVAVSFSSSFPALNIAVMSATSVLGIRPVIISSIGASMYGANSPDLTWLDMERLLNEHRVFPYRSIAASLGGVSDTRGGIDGTGVDIGLAIIARNKVTYLDEGGVATQRHDIRRRLDLYDKTLNGMKPAAFINVGASQTSLGSSPKAYQLPTGLLKRVEMSDDPDRGIIFHMLDQGVPVIHLLKLRELARQFEIPFDPPSPQEVVYAPTGNYSRSTAIMALVALLFCIALLTHRFAAGHRTSNST